MLSQASLLSRSRNRSPAPSAMKSCPSQWQFSHAITDFVEDALLTWSIAKKVPASTVGNKSPQLSEMQPLLASFRITSRLILNKKEIQNKKKSKRLKAFSALILSIFTKKFTEKLLLSPKQSRLSLLEEEEAEEQLE